MSAAWSVLITFLCSSVLCSCSKFVGVEELEEYYCECCRKLCPGVVHSSIHTLPDVLILHLKRLVMNATGGGKIRTLVKFPLVDLDMCPYTTGAWVVDVNIVGCSVSSRLAHICYH